MSRDLLEKARRGRTDALATLRDQNALDRLHRRPVLTLLLGPDELAGPLFRKFDVMKSAA